MSDSVEYLFAATITLADRAARKQVWYPHGRTGLAQYGNQVHFVCFEEQLAVIGKHVTVHFVGSLSPQIRRFDRKWVQLRA